MKLRAPKGITTCSVGGHEYPIGKDGLVTVPDANAGVMIADHGFVDVDAEKILKTESDALDAARDEPDDAPSVAAPKAGGGTSGRAGAGSDRPGGSHRE